MTTVSAATTLGPVAVLAGLPAHLVGVLADLARDEIAPRVLQDGRAARRVRAGLDGFLREELREAGVDAAVLDSPALMGLAREAGVVLSVAGVLHRAGYRSART